MPFVQQQYIFTAVYVLALASSCTAAIINNSSVADLYSAKYINIVISITMLKIFREWS